MKTPFRKTISSIAVSALLFICAPANATLIFGSAAQTQFDGYVTTLGDNFENFDGFSSLSPQTNLTTQIAGLTFLNTLTRFGSPPPAGTGVNVICSPSQPYYYHPSCTSPDHMIGGVRSGGLTDGQSRYEINFLTGQLRAGVVRHFSTWSLTRFFSGATLLGEHRNTANREFVGFLSDGINLITRIEVDGLVHAPSGSYQVGYVDELYWGNTSQGNVPEPASLALLGLGLAGLGFLRRKRSA